MRFGAEIKSFTGFKIGNGRCMSIVHEGVAPDSLEIEGVKLGEGKVAGSDVVMCKPNDRFKTDHVVHFPIVDSTASMKVFDGELTVGTPAYLVSMNGNEMELVCGVLVEMTAGVYTIKLNRSLKTDNGQSGSPWFVMQGTSPQVFAVHSRLMTGKSAECQALAVALPPKGSLN
jgi:hypothetical protein